MSRVHVTNFKPGPFPGQTTRPQRGDTSLVSNLGQGIVLIHELRQLAGTKELLDCCRYRLRIDHVLGHQTLRIRHTKTFLNSPLYPYQTDPELVLCHLADRPNTAVTQVIDIIYRAETIADTDQCLQHVNDIFLAQHHRSFGFGPAQSTIKLHASYRRQIVTLG